MKSVAGPGQPSLIPKLYLPLLALLAGALFLRLFGITIIGVGGNDTILYYSLAEQWLKGNFVFEIGDSIQVFRPVLLGFNALALKIFGHSDYAIKLANVLLDVVNMLLLSLLAWLVSRRLTVVIASALTYAFLPIAVWSSRQELPHTSSTFFVLVACLFIWFALSGRYRRYSLLHIFLAGLSVSAASFTHEELIFLAAPISVFLLIAVHSQNTVVPLASGLKQVAIFCVAPLAAVATISFHELAIIQSVISGSITSVGSSDRVFLEVFGRFLWDGIVGSTSAPFAIAVAACIGYLCWCCRGGARNPDASFKLWVGFCLFVPVSFVGIYALFFSTLFARGFLPLVPLLIVAVFHTLAKVTERAGSVRAGFILVAVALAFDLSSVAGYSAFNVGNRQFSNKWAEPVWPTRVALKKGAQGFIFDARYARGYATHWRALFDAFDGIVDDQNRLLLLPSTVFYIPGRRALQTEVYFGDNAIYRVDHAQLSLAEIVRDYNVKVIVFTTGQLRATPTVLGPYLYNGQWAEPEPLDLAVAYGMDTYSVATEFESMLRYLRAVGATEVFPFASGGFDYRESRSWLLP